MRPHLTNTQRQRLHRILPTVYRPAEIAQLLGLHVSTIRKNWLSQGCPHIKDSAGHVLIDGEQFLAWIVQFAPHINLEEGEAYCFACGTPQPMKNQRLVTKKVRLIEGDCPICGRKIYRFNKESVYDCKKQLPNR